MSTWTETREIVLMNLRAIPDRLAPSLVIVIGIAGVVAVMVALLSMSSGLNQTLGTTGREDQVVVTRGGPQGGELSSFLGIGSMTLIKQDRAVARGTDGLPLASGELIVITEVPRPGQSTGANVSLRGVEPVGFALRPEFEAMNDLIRDANEAFPGLNRALIDIDATIAQLTGTALSVRQTDFRRSIADALDPAGAASRAFVDAGRMQLTDAVALGLGGDEALMRDIFRVFGQGLARSGLGFGAMTDALEDLEAAAAEAGITVTGLADAALSAADEPLAIFAAGLTASIAAIDAQTSAIESQVSQWQSLGEALSRGRVARSLNPEISVLDPQARMQAALADYEQIRAAALGGDQTAIGRFDSAGDAALKAFVDYFGQTNQNTVELCNRIQGDRGAIEDMAVTQIDLLQSQLTELQAIRASLDAAGGSGGVHGGELRARQYARVVQRPVGLGLPGQADIGAADVGEEALRVHRTKRGQRPHDPAALRQTAVRGQRSLLFV